MVVANYIDEPTFKSTFGEKSSGRSSPMKGRGGVCNFMDCRKYPPPQPLPSVGRGVPFGSRHSIRDFLKWTHGLHLILKLSNSWQNNLRKMRQSTTIISFEIQFQKVVNISYFIKSWVKVHLYQHFYVTLTDYLFIFHKLKVVKEVK